MKILRSISKVAFFALAISFVFPAAFFAAVPPQTAQAQVCGGIEEGVGGSYLTLRRSIVPCGRSCDEPSSTTINETDPCTLCHLLIMLKNIFDLLFAWLIIVSLLMMTIAGVIYILGLGNQARLAMAKYIVEKTLGGFALFILSWLVVYTLLVVLSVDETMLGLTRGTDQWFEFSCNTTSSYGSVVMEPPEPPTATPEREAEVRARLAAHGGISIWESSPGATEVGGLRESTIQGVMDFQSEFGGPIIITGGSETGPHSSGTYSHANGYKVDIEDTPAVNSYIESNYTYVGVRGDGAALYSDGRGNVYARETTHWDVCYGCG